MHGSHHQHEGITTDRWRFRSTSPCHFRGRRQERSTATLSRQCGPDGCGEGGTCGSCPAGQDCNEVTGQCPGPPACTPQTCPQGCCDSQGVCQIGFSGQACGTGGAPCTPCQFPMTCGLGEGCCVEDPLRAATRQTPSSPSHTCPFPFPTLCLASTGPEQPVAAKTSAAAPRAKSNIR